MEILIPILLLALWYLIVSHICLLLFILFQKFLIRKGLSFTKLYISSIKKKKVLIVIGIISTAFLIFFLSTFIVFWGKDPSSRPMIIINGVEETVRGKIQYSLADSMVVGESYTGVAFISKALNDSVFFKEQLKSYKNETISVSSRMKVSLIDPENGKNFTITALNSNEQYVNSSQRTKWEWNIRPLKSGDKTLILRATVKLWTERGDRTRDIPVFRKTVNVRSSFSNESSLFLRKNWQFLVSAVLIPLIIWTFQRIKSNWRKKSNPIGFKK